MLSVPLYRTGSTTPQERFYEDTKQEWLGRFKGVLDRASRPAMRERDKLKNAMVGRMRIWQQRLGNLVLRGKHGDPEIRIPSPQELLDRLIMEFASI